MENEDVFWLNIIVSLCLENKFNYEWFDLLRLKVYDEERKVVKIVVIFSIIIVLMLICF